MELAFNLGYDFRKLREKLASRISKVIPFSSDRKRMTSIVDYKNDKTTFRIYTKGAPDILLDKCTHFIDSTGKTTIITLDFR